MPYACPPHLRHLRHLRRVWLVLSLVLLASPAQATTVVAKPFSAVVQAAEIIAVGTVTAIAAGVEQMSGDVAGRGSAAGLALGSFGALDGAPGHAGGGAARPGDWVSVDLRRGD